MKDNRLLKVFFGGYYERLKHGIWQLFSTPRKSRKWYLMSSHCKMVSNPVDCPLWLPTEIRRPGSPRNLLTLSVTMLQGYPWSQHLVNGFGVLFLHFIGMGPHTIDLILCLTVWTQGFWDPATLLSLWTICSLCGLAFQDIHLHLSVSGKFPECHLSKRAEMNRENSHPHEHTSLAGVTKEWSYWVTPNVYGLHCQSLMKQQYIDVKQSLLNKRRGPFSRCTYQLGPRNQIQFSSVLLPAMDPSPGGRSYTQFCSSISGELP